jgi:hypothetical protein
VPRRSISDLAQIARRPGEAGGVDVYRGMQIADAAEDG